MEMEPANNDFSVRAVFLLRTDFTGVSWQETARGASSNIAETGKITLGDPDLRLMGLLLLVAGETCSSKQG